MFKNQSEIEARKKWTFSPHGAVGYIRTNDTSNVTNRSGYRCFTSELHFKVPTPYGLINITEHINHTLKKSSVIDGLCYVGAMHITAGIYVNDAESGLLHDISKWIENLAPFNLDYKHHQTGEDNGDAHLKSFLTNHQIVVPITNSELDFGTWQQVFYAEYDGMREKRIMVKVCGLVAEV